MMWFKILILWIISLFKKREEIPPLNPYRFNLLDYTRSQTATRYNINNTPTNQQKFYLENLHKGIVVPIMKHFGKENIVISSGFRCPELNRKIGSSDKSQHVRGQAVDIEVKGISNKVLFKWIANNLVYDQLILEFFNPKEPQSGWCHVSFLPIAHGFLNRKELLKATKQKDGRVIYTRV